MALVRYIGAEDDSKIQMAFTRKEVEARKTWLTQGMLERRERRRNGRFFNWECSVFKSGNLTRKKFNIFTIRVEKQYGKVESYFNNQYITNYVLHRQI